MQAVIRTGGKQEKVRPGDVIEVEHLKIDPGSAVEFEPLLVIDEDGVTHHGKDLAQAKVVAQLLGDKLGEKIKVFKYKNKTGYTRTQGHRQRHTLLEIQEVALSPDKVARMPEKPVEEAPAEKPEVAKKPVAKKAAAKKSAPPKKAAAKKSAPKKKAAAKKPAPKKKAAPKKAAAKKPAPKKKS